MISFRQKGDFSKLTSFLEKAKESVKIGDLDKYGREGVAALSSATPIDSGKTANSWSYEITNKNGSVTISFNNSNIQNGVPIAIILQYGHGTKNGGWVQGRDYINPAIQPVFDEIVDKARLVPLTSFQDFKNLFARFVVKGIKLSGKRNCKGSVAGCCILQIKLHRIIGINNCSLQFFYLFCCERIDGLEFFDPALRHFLLAVFNCG